MAQYAVKSIVAVLPLKAGSERYFYRNAVVSDETITGDGIEHAVSAGLIEAVPELELEPVEVVQTPPPSGVSFTDEQKQQPPAAPADEAKKATAAKTQSK